ncbi:DUF192 domain-containing protein [bacterium]|nr:DUF192 domain-containing protein [bacterium]
MVRLIFLLILILQFFSSILSASELGRVTIKTTIISIEVVSTDYEQSMGLGNRFSLPEGQGMLFVYERPDSRIFWMKRMHFPIDIIWILRNKIVHIEKKVTPPAADTSDRNLKRYGAGVIADMVLELPAGYAQRKGFAPGDRVFLEYQ